MVHLSNSYQVDPHNNYVLRYPLNVSNDITSDFNLIHSARPTYDVPTQDAGWLSPSNTCTWYTRTLWHLAMWSCIYTYGGIPLVWFPFHRGLNKTTNIFHGTYSNANSWQKIIVFSIKFAFLNAAISWLNIFVSGLKCHRFSPNNKSSLDPMSTPEQATRNNINQRLLSFVTPYGVSHYELKLLSRPRLCSERIQLFVRLVLCYRYIK